MQIALGKNKILAVVLAIAVVMNVTLYVNLRGTPVPLPSRADSLYGFLYNLPHVFTSNWAADHSGIRSSGIAAVSGDVSVKNLSSESSVPLTADYVPSQGDMIVSSGDGSAVLTLDSDKEIFIDANTVLELADVKIDSNTNGYVTRLMLHEGNVLSSVHQPLGEHDIYEVRTPMLDMAIRGTTVHVGYDKSAKSSTVAFLTGRGLIKNNDTGEVIDLVAGEQIVQNVDGYVKGDVDKNLLPAYIESSLSNFDEIMLNIDTIDYRAAYTDNGFSAENYTFEQNEVVVNEAKATEATEADKETQPPVIQTILENLGLDFGRDNDSRDTGNRSSESEPTPELPPELPPEITPELTPPVISEAYLPDATVGVQYSENLTATNNPTSWMSSGNLPYGLSLEASSGIISGAPASKGEFGFTVTATNDDGVSQPVRFKITVNDAPIYAISATTPLVFGSLQEEYAQPTAKIVTVTNTGNKSVDLLQPEASDNYVIGKLSNTALNVNEEATFTVQPKSGLLAGAYSETITITGSNGANTDVNVSFVVTEPEPMFRIHVQSQLVSFDSLQEGYVQPAAKTVTISNIGNRTVELIQPKADNYDIGNLTKTTLGINEQATFTIQPKAGLSAGAYPETITITGSGEVSADVQINFAVVKKSQSSVQVQPGSLSFGSLKKGYEQSTVQTVTITNTSNSWIRLEQPSSGNYDISNFSPKVVTANAKTTFTIQPKAGLSAGNYDEKINIKWDERISFGNWVDGDSQELEVTLTVEDAQVPIITTTPGALAKGTVGTEYWVKLNADNNPTMWMPSNGFPNGLSLDENGVISGTPTHAGTFEFTVTAKNADGISNPVWFSITVEETQFVKVDGIIGLPTEIWVGESLILSGSVTPSNATYQDIKWSYKKTGQFEADLDGNIFTVTSANNGNVTIEMTATIANGKGPGEDYKETFKINVNIGKAKANIILLPCENCGQIGCDGSCVCSECGEIECKEDCICEKCIEIDSVDILSTPLQIDTLDPDEDSEGLSTAAEEDEDPSITEEPIEPIDIIKEENDGDEEDQSFEGDDESEDDTFATSEADDIAPIPDASEPEPQE